jgi:hypothetical protein
MISYSGDIVEVPMTAESLEKGTEKKTRKDRQNTRKDLGYIKEKSVLSFLAGRSFLNS